MVAVPIPHPGQAASPRSMSSGSTNPSKSSDWTSIVAAGTLVTGGVLLAVGHRRAGLAVAATGAALAMIEEREALEKMWKELPGYLREAQTLLDKVEGYLNEAVAQGNKLQGMIRR